MHRFPIREEFEIWEGSVVGVGRVLRVLGREQTNRSNAAISATDRPNSAMSDIAVVREGTWLYDGTLPTGVRIVSSPIRYGSGDYEDPPDVRDDYQIAGFDVQWASPTTPRLYSEFASARFSTLQEAIAHVEKAAWASATLEWDGG